MTPEVIRDILKKTPFEPLRLHLIDGESYEIRHPDLVMIGLRELILGISSRRKDGIYQRVVYVSLVNLGRIEILEPNNADSSPPENPAA